MKTISVICLALLSGPALFAQGITFEEGDWASVVAKAKSSNRIIYVDAYTTWCGPCKMLAANIFPKKEAGDYYNAHFINYRVDAEKGEGITLAQKYAVTGYPTHLFIEPGGKIVYRASGYSADVNHFVHEGEVAGLEWKDPMTLEKYRAHFAAKRKDKEFLKDYLQKTERLNQNNDEVLDAYVALLDPKKLSDEEVIFLQKNIRSLDNNAVALVKSKKDVFARKFPENKTYLQDVSGRWVGGTFEKAVDSKNERLLVKMADALKDARPKEAEEEMFFWRARYYTQTGNKAEADKIAAQEAAHYFAKTDEQYAAADAAALTGVKEQIRWQLKEMKVADDKLDELVEKNLAAKPSMKHSSSALAASKLNSSAWGVYENYPANSARVKEALAWSRKSLQLIEGSPDEWPAYADTYAHLLYVSGEKEEAVRMEQQAADKLKAAGSEEAATYEAEANKMRSGTL